MAKAIPVIDMWSPIVPSREIMEHVANHFPELQLSYLSIFQKRDVSLEEYREVACDFPDLTLILSHAGYPWVLESCLVAWKHPKVYLELGAHRPKYFAAPGAGWDALLRYGQSTIQDKILYGTGAFLIGQTPQELLKEFHKLRLSRRSNRSGCTTMP